MNDLDRIFDHLIEIKESVASIGTRVDKIDKDVSGNGQPGLRQRVESLEGTKNKAWGAMAAIGAAWTGLMGLIEWLMHRHH